MDEEQENQIPYSQLKLQIIAAASDRFSLEEVKDHYADQINSKRLLDRAKSLQEVFQLLEKRDLLSHKKVSPLLSLGVLIANERIKELVRSYKKIVLDEDDGDACEICSVSFVDTLPCPLTDHNQNSVLSSRNAVTVDCLSEALDNISLSIGMKWGVLARELGIREILIDNCIERHPADYAAQARLALEIWCEMEKENATIERLDKALELRLCKREGFGVHLRKPIVGIDMFR